MAVKCDPTQWRVSKFPNRLIPRILKLVLSSWRSFEKPEDGELEIRITNRFADHLRNSRDARRLPFAIDPKVPIWDPKTGKLVAEIDLRFLPARYREAVYFAFECKKMNVRRSDTADPQGWEYVNEGMKRFVDGKYADGLDAGGMIAYVMDGNVTTAIETVKRNILRSSTSLCLCHEEALLPSRCVPDVQWVRESRHRMRKPDFCLHHVFLAAC